MTRLPKRCRPQRRIPRIPTPACPRRPFAHASDYDGYYYFIFWNDDSGKLQYQFSRTYEEHQQAIAEHLQ